MTETSSAAEGPSPTKSILAVRQYAAGGYVESDRQLALIAERERLKALNARADIAGTSPQTLTKLGKGLGLSSHNGAIKESRPTKASSSLPKTKEIIDIWGNRTLINQNEFPAIQQSEVKNKAKPSSSQIHPQKIYDTAFPALGSDGGPKKAPSNNLKKTPQSSVKIGVWTNDSSKSSGTPGKFSTNSRGEVSEPNQQAQTHIEEALSAPGARENADKGSNEAIALRRRNDLEGVMTVPKVEHVLSPEAIALQERAQAQFGGAFAGPSESKTTEHDATKSTKPPNEAEGEREKDDVKAEKPKDAEKAENDPKQGVLVDF